MFQLAESLQAWSTDNFELILKKELEHIDVNEFPLQNSLLHSSVASTEGLKFILINAVEETGEIRVKVGIFYSGIIAGCNCADDPTPVEPIQEYCEIELSIDKASANTSIKPAE
jgi:hypothetical protein